MKKTLIILPIILIISMLFTSCGGPYKGREGEVADILRPLLESEIELIGYLYGDSFGTLTEVEQKDREYTTTAVYYRVSADAPYHSVAELQDAMKEVYSTEKVSAIKSGLFENREGTFSRFCDYTGYADMAETVELTDLQIDVTANNPTYTFTAVIDLSSLTVKRSTETIIELTVGYTDEVSGRESDMTLRLLKEDNGWRLDSQTWAKGYIN